MTTNELRAKFENWWMRNGDPLNLHKVVAWETWQAAHVSRDAEVEALRKDSERYRWPSRKHANPVENEWYVYGATGAFLSDSIDDAMRKGE